MTDNSTPRPPRQIDALTATVDQLAAELATVDRQLALLLVATTILSIAVGVLLCAR